MPWRYEGIDDKVEVVVEPSFRGDLIGLAHSRPVWIIDTAQNRAQIDEAWSVGASQDLCEVNRCRVDEENDRCGNLMMIMGMLDDHAGRYSLIVHGLHAKHLSFDLGAEGFVVTEATEDGFIALRVPGVRERLIGRE